MGRSKTGESTFHVTSNSVYIPVCVCACACAYARAGGEGISRKKHKKNKHRKKVKARDDENRVVEAEPGVRPLTLKIKLGGKPITSTAVER